MAIVDIILLICFIPAIVSGISKGFVRQVVEIAAILLGAWVAFRYSSIASIWLSQHIEADKIVLHVICFIVILILTAGLLTLGGHLLTKILKVVSLGWINGALGVVLGIIKAAMIMGLVIIAFDAVNDSIHLIDKESLDNAVIYNKLNELGNDIFPRLRSLITGIDE